METTAVVLEVPERLSLRRLGLRPLADGDVVVRVDHSGISTGTERMLYRGTMPAFPGMGYPLVPGYESVGRVIDAGAGAEAMVGATVFVPGASCYTDARGLFGGAARTVILPAARAFAIDPALGADAPLLALAATAHHALAGQRAPDLIVGHGVLGRLLARLTIALGNPAPVVWETDRARADGARGYAVTDAASDDRRDYGVIVDVSGTDLLDTLIPRLARQGEIVLAGFYDRLGFAFPPAFMREATIRIAAEFRPADLAAVAAVTTRIRDLLTELVTHRTRAEAANDAYATAFGDPACLKMVLDWSDVA
ncbi:MAG: chlorophyll synthesis pathway protein BchC [Sphingomonadaceae bacterium]|nr:chlorophyll synthesis pathway protein BchC [Sphingomonadaceae bacterium]